MKLTEIAFIFKMMLMLRWKQFSRAPQFGQRLAMRILAGVIGLYLFLNLLFIGYFLPFILSKTHPDAAIPALVNGYILHVFLVLLAVRYFMQKLPAVQLQAYFTLPVRKSRLVLAYLGLLSLHGFNYVPIILALPLFVQQILPAYPIANSLLWLAGILLLSLASSTIIVLIKMFTFDRPFLFIIFLLVLTGLFLLDQLPVLTVLPTISGALFDGLLVGNWLVLIALAALTGLLTFLLFRVLRGKLYLPEGRNTSSKKAAGTTSIATARFGKIWLLFWLEGRLLWRNRVTRLVAGFSFFFMPWGLWTLYQMGDRIAINPFGFAFAAIMASGSVFVLSYAGSLFSWEGTYFDALLARSFFIRELIYHKVLFFAVANAALLILCATTFHWLRSDFIVFILAIFLYNSAFVTFIYIYAALFHRKAFPVNGSVFATGGWQGKTFWNIGKIVLLYFPFVILMIFRENLKINRETIILAAGVISLIGLISLCFWLRWRNMLVNKFRQQKYAMAEGFRQS